MQAARARAREVLAVAPLDNRNIDARQRQLAGQHQPGRTSADDRHRMIGHHHPPVVATATVKNRWVLRDDRGLEASPWRATY